MQRPVASAGFAAGVAAAVFVLDAAVVVSACFFFEDVEASDADVVAASAAYLSLRT